MKTRNKIFTAALCVAVLIAVLCFTVTAATDGTVALSFVSMHNGVAVIDVTLSEVTEGKAADYVQLTLTPQQSAVDTAVTEVTTAVENLSIEYQVAEDGTLTVLAIPTAAGVAMEDGDTVCSLKISGVTGGSTLNYAVSSVLCFTDGTDTENQAVDMAVSIDSATYNTTLQAETHGVLNRYKVSGTVAGGMTKDASKMMTLAQLQTGKGMGNAVGHPMVTYTVEVDTAGTYTIEYVYNVCTTSSYTVNDYAITVSVNDQVTTVPFAPRDASVDTTTATNVVGKATLNVDLVKGRNVIRMISCTADNAAMVSWMDHDYMYIVGPGKIEGIVSTANHLLPGQSQYVNKWTVNTLTNTEAAGYEYRSSYLGGVEVYTFDGENLSTYELSGIPYVAYTVDVPADGYYDIGTHLVTKTGTDADEGHLLLIVDGVKYSKYVCDNAGYIVNNNPMWTQYLTAGTHTIAVTAMYEHSFEGNFWCDMAGLTVYGGITLAQTQVDPMVWANLQEHVYISVNGNDAALGTEDAPVASLNTALIRVADGGTIHIDGTCAVPADFEWYAADNAVTITGGTLDLSAQSTVNINSAVTFKDMTLKVADDGEIFCNGYTTKIDSDVTVSGVALIFGGVSTGSVASTDLTVLAGTWYSIYGGNGGGSGNTTTVTGTAKLTVGGNVNPDITAVDHNEQNYVFAGSRRGTLAKTEVVFEGNAKAAKLFGGGSGRASADWCDVYEANVTVNGGQIYGVYGGNIYGPGVDDCVINITVNGGVIDQLFGGHEWAHDNLDGDVNIWLKGGTVNRRIYGGCYNQCGLTFDTDRHVIGNINVYVYGSFNMAYNSSSSDRSLYAHSRHNSPAAEEISSIWLMDLAAYTKYADKLGAQDSTMKAIMGDTTPADNIYHLAYSHEKWNLTLRDNIAVNFHVAIADEFAESAVMYITVGGSVKQVAAKDVAQDADGNYIFTVELAAAQMTEELSLQMHIGDIAGEAKTYTVKQYADYILAGDYSDSTKALVSAMLNYGGKAQTYFQYNLENMADSGVEVTENDVPAAAATDLSASGSISGLSFYGASLVHRNQTAVRIYFKGDVTGCSFSCNGNALEVVSKDDLYYVEVANILPQDLDEAVTVTVTDSQGSTITVSYSPMNYIVRMYHGSASDSLKALLSAMYTYHQAAENYTAE